MGATSLAEAGLTDGTSINVVAVPRPPQLSSGASRMALAFAPSRAMEPPWRQQLFLETAPRCSLHLSIALQNFGAQRTALAFEPSRVMAIRWFPRHFLEMRPPCSRHLQTAPASSGVSRMALD